MEEIKRVAAYIRVSTEEQKKHGYSIETQRANITEYLSKQNNMALVDFYVDEGISANKLTKRLGLQRLLEDVKADKIDMIIFTKLDRWFRSVQKYYQIQEVLDAHNVVWKTIHEDYETVTSSGKFKVNIMLSVAQNERDKTSERITDVFKYRVKEGYAITGAQPFGFKVENKKVVIDEEKREIVNDIINYYELTNSLRKTLVYVREKHDVYMHSNTLKYFLRNPKLCGSFRGNENYCEAYITKERFDRIQCALKKNIPIKKNSVYYMFSGLVICDHCNHRMVGSHYKEYKYYRCNYYAKERRCNNNLQIREEAIEKELLKKIEPKLKATILEVEQMEEKSKQVKSNRKKIEKQLDRLFELYKAGGIELDKYMKECSQLNAEIVDDPVKKPELTVIKDFLKSNKLEIYSSQTFQEKQIMWRSLVKEIRINGKEVVDIIPILT